MLMFVFTSANAFNIYITTLLQYDTEIPLGQLLPPSSTHSIGIHIVMLLFRQYTFHGHHNTDLQTTSHGTVSDIYIP